MTDPRPNRAVLAGLLLAVSVTCGTTAAGTEPAPHLQLEEPPRYGVYYDAYEPTFYTGFAPRAREPRRLHLHIGRGNQLRVTLVLSDAVIEAYARDLLDRQQTYRRLIAAGEIALTQNRGFEQFDERLDGMDLARLVAEEDALSRDALRARNLDLMERLNPRRVFRIRMAEDEVMRRWLAELRAEDGRAMESARALGVANALLPTRLYVTGLDRESAHALRALVARGLAARQAGTSEALEELRPAYFALLDRLSGGIYPRRGGAVRFEEFTAIYPVGSLNEFTDYRGRRIPLYPTPGKWRLTTHQRTKTVDHIPDVAVYSYSPWIPYMHVGPRLHNSFHTLWWTMEPDSTPFLPAAWRTGGPRNRDGQRHARLWLLSRGPMSHGCTHVNAGHLAELRQLLPAESARLYEVDVFINQSPLYDVFDIDGDFRPEVVGVRYFIAYSLQDKQAHRLRVRNERHPFYAWLYAGELGYDGDGGGVFEEARACRFVGDRAVPGRRYENIALYEADYEPERIQFYRLVDIPFARELRRIGVDYPLEPQRPRRR